MYLSPESYLLSNSSTRSFPHVSSLLERGSGEVCEDVILAHEGRIFGVFDGATSLLPSRLEKGKSGGSLAARICADTFCENDEELSETAWLANKRIYEQARAFGINYTVKEELWSASAAVVRLCEDDFEWCQIGDCNIVVLYGDNSYKVLAEDPCLDRDTLRAWQQKSAQDSCSIMEAVAPEILQVRRRMNIDYGVFNGEQEALSFLQGGIESRTQVTDIILFSDGLLLPQEEPAAPADMDTLVSLYKGGGLKKLRDYVRSKQLSDIDCRRYPRFKTHDDIGAVALRLGQ